MNDLRNGTQGIAVLFSNGNHDQDFSYVFIAGKDTPETVVDLVTKAEEDGYKAIRSQAVTYTYKGWQQRIAEPTLRQRLGIRPTWKVA